MRGDEADLSRRPLRGENEALVEEEEVEEEKDVEDTLKVLPFPSFSSIPPKLLGDELDRTAKGLIREGSALLLVVVSEGLDSPPALTKAAKSLRVSSLAGIAGTG